MTLFFLLEFCISLLDCGNSANSHQLSVLLCCTLHTKGKVPFWRVFRMQVYVSAVTNWVKRVWFLLHPGVSYSSCHLSVENGVNTRHLLCQVHVYSFACVNCIVNIFPSKIYSAILSPLFFVCVFFNFTIMFTWTQILPLMSFASTPKAEPCASWTVIVGDDMQPKQHQGSHDFICSSSYLYKKFQNKRYIH